MKLYYFAIATAIMLVFFSCGKKEEATKVTVGMTYEEVEAILGKPASILRGMNELYSDVNTLPEEIVNTLNTDTTETANDEQRWMAPHEVKTMDESMYTTWVYDDSKTETYYVLYNKFKDEKGTTSKKVPVYYVNDKQVTKEVYDATKETSFVNTEKQKNTEPIKKTKIPMDSLKTKMKTNELPQGKIVKKRIEYITKTSQTSKQVIESVDKVNYEVQYKLCVVFDASSGRVTFYDYLPFTVKELSKEPV